MYTFTPVTDIPVHHVGFWIFLCVIIIALSLSLLADPYEFSKYFTIACIPVAFAYMVSYHISDQSTQTFKNEKVTGTFVGYQPEGYNERSGKSRADRHYMYVIYSVDGSNIIFQGQEGIQYPKTAVLYKN